MNKGLKFLLYLLALMLIIVPTIFAFTLFNSSKNAFDDSFSQSDQRQSQLRDSKVNAAKQPISILFLGIDDSSTRRQNGQSAENARTDAMILSTMNPDKHQIRLVSIPRDTLSYIPEVGYYDKITHAHAYGGPEASMRTVEANLNVPVDYYVRINMEAFAKTVDELGGIEYDVPYDLNEPNTMDKGRIKLKKGKQQLNGDEVLAVTRTRKQDSDLKRGQRQMEVLKILFKKAQDTKSLHKLDDIIEIVGKNSKHNLSYSEIKALATNYLANDVDIQSQQLKGENELLNGIYYINPDVDNLIETSNTLRKDLGLAPFKDRNQFLVERVKAYYGEIPPLTYLEESLLQNVKKLMPKDENNDQNNKGESADNTNGAMHNQQQGVPYQNQNPDGSYY
ncbi:LCP family protein [Staphylococcus pseudintermedius]|uniref:LCP family protein n=1 Tax=Staphylococcus pseudintermedius TaxID=283734 RepID=UPI0007AE4025|nr:LCP family protein [Staphylococcus pseudintermedius]EGQ0317123.1 LCP family protein [Staphylococcus pseudintermedius]EGQ1276630.1 LytR family transcriptional regulator [Staphylococcus pseudintermedius]EGQ1625598.1 LytR family transcriptional regulator [Staphylococcus pseudintermedius]EGQ1661364.1 LytR family transcriptional regulator [Staphylococcus pseudintermedius]EGQ2696276.1 LCP family protein [Staphylococcus pseudintermedius]